MRFNQIINALFDFQKAVPASDFKVEEDQHTGRTTAVLRVDLTDEEADLFMGAMAMFSKTF